jgi:hypothetical protein
VETDPDIVEADRRARERPAALPFCHSDADERVGQLDDLFAATEVRTPSGIDRCEGEEAPSERFILAL